LDEEEANGERCTSNVHPPNIKEINHFFDKLYYFLLLSAQVFFYFSFDSGWGLLGSKKISIVSHKCDKVYISKPKK
jgi:hypothetical protein